MNEYQFKEKYEELKNEYGASLMLLKEYFADDLQNLVEEFLEEVE